MKMNEILYNLKLFYVLFKFFMLPIFILSKCPSCMAKDEICIGNDKFAIRVNRFARTYNSADIKYFNDYGELIVTGLLNLEECSDKNFHQLSYCKGNIKKYLNSCMMRRKEEKMMKLLEELTTDKQ